MSLDWDATACDKRVLDETEWPTTEALIFATIPLGMRTITADNVDVFAARLAAWQKVYGPLMSQWTGAEMTGVVVTVSDVRKRIGLRTNASPITDAKFRQTLVRRLMQDAADEVAAERRRLDEAETEAE